MFVLLIININSNKHESGWNRYGNNEIVQSNVAAVSSQKLPYNLSSSGGKKLKHVIKTVDSNLTFKTETEDTCGDDFFSTHVQRKNNENQLNK